MPAKGVGKRFRVAILDVVSILFFNLSSHRRKPLHRSKLAPTPTRLWAVKLRGGSAQQRETAVLRLLRCTGGRGGRFTCNAAICEFLWTAPKGLPLYSRTILSSFQPVEWAVTSVAVRFGSEAICPLSKRPQQLSCGHESVAPPKNQCRTEGTLQSSAVLLRSVNSPVVCWFWTGSKSRTTLRA